MDNLATLIMIQIKIGQIFTEIESKFLLLNQKVTAKKPSNKISKSQWPTKITITCSTVLQEKMQDKLAYKTTIHNKYSLSKENKNEF